MISGASHLVVVLVAASSCAHCGGPEPDCHHISPCPAQAYFTAKVALKEAQRTSARLALAKGATSSVQRRLMTTRVKQLERSVAQRRREIFHQRFGAQAQKAMAQMEKEEDDKAVELLRMQKKVWGRAWRSRQPGIALR